MRAARRLRAEEFCEGRQFLTKASQKQTPPVSILAARKRGTRCPHTAWPPSSAEKLRHFDGIHAEDRPVTPSWTKTWTRLSRMSRDELKFRAKQEIGKRVDLVKYRVGLLAAFNRWNVAPAKWGTFFFSVQEVPSRVALLRSHLPQEAEAIVREADEICRHEFTLLGYENLDYGDEIEWQCDASQGIRAPGKPWFKISFLDFSVVGDHKVTWELNRHQHLVTLAKAWALTRDDKYSSEAARQWYAWKRANRFPMGINWASSLEVAIRSLSWLWMRFLLDDCAEVTAEFEGDLLHALALNGTHIEGNLSTYFSPNTHLLGEAAALFFIGTLCPQIPRAQRWKVEGWRILLQEAERQVWSDGVYFEQSLYYHVYALDFLLHARLLALCNGVEIPPRFDATLGRMLSVLRAVSQGGPPEGFGDDDGGRVFNARRNRSEHLTDPLAVGAIQLGRDDLIPAAGLTEESVWLFGEKAVPAFSKRASEGPLKSAAFHEGGIYVMASSEQRSQRMVIDAGPMGAGRAGHGHADALSVTVALGGRRWLIDPGTYCYVSPDDGRNRFRATHAHNTMTVDGLDQAVLEKSFAWSSLPNVCVERWLMGDSFSLFRAYHDGYSRLNDPVLHRRLVFHLYGGFWLVHDLAEGSGRHTLETSWHFAPDVEVQSADGSFMASPASRQADSDGCGLALIPEQNTAWTGKVTTGEVSPAYGKKESAPVVRMSADALLPAGFATLIVPLLDRSDSPGRLRRLGANEVQGNGDVGGYRYDTPRDQHSMILSSGHEPYGVGPWSSDAEFLYCGIRDGEVTKIILCNASFAKLNGQSILMQSRRVAKIEWQRGAVKPPVPASHAPVGTVAFSEEALRTCELAG